MGAVARVNSVVIGIATERPLDAVAVSLAGVLNVTLAERHSLFFGGSYYRNSVFEDEEVYVMRNFDAVDGSLAYEEAQDCPVVLGIDHTNRTGAEVVRQVSSALGTPARVLRGR